MENQEKKALYFYGEKNAEWKGVTHNRRLCISGVFSENSIKIGVAMCSKKDRFVKAKGRAIAEGRAKGKPIHTIIINDNIKGITPSAQFFMYAKNLVPKK